MAHLSFGISFCHLVIFHRCPTGFKFEVSILSILGTKITFNKNTKDVFSVILRILIKYFITYLFI